jgi:hypothetical protein
MAGQVWSKADFDGSNTGGFKGGPGSVLAVTRHNFGPDGIPNTADDLHEAMNATPGISSIDNLPGPDCADNEDRVRGFAGHHPGGVVFAFGDGSVRLVNESTDPYVYTGMSTMRGGEILSAE